MIRLGDRKEGGQMDYGKMRKEVNRVIMHLVTVYFYS